MAKNIVRFIVLIVIAWSLVACSSDSSTPATKIWVNQSPRIENCSPGERQILLNQADSSMTVDSYLDSMMPANACIEALQ